MNARSQEAVVAPDEETVVHEWRLHQFRQLGFAEPDAYLLARRPEVSVASVRALLDKGCPLDTAIRIVS